MTTAIDKSDQLELELVTYSSLGWLRKEDDILIADKIVNSRTPGPSSGIVEDMGEFILVRILQY